MPRNADGQGRRPHKWHGRWRAFVTLGYKLDGRADRWYVYGRTQRECQARLDEARAAVKRGAVKRDTLTVDAYLDAWLADVEPTIAARTLEIYRSELAHLRPHVGRVQLAKLTPKHVQRAMRAIVGTEVRYGRKGKGGQQSAVLTARSANAARLVLHNALAAAVADGLIPFNPATKERTRQLREPPGEIVVWTAAEIEAFLATTRAGACALHALFYVALTTGLRIGELGALEWGDVTRSSLTVRRSLGSDGTKTPTGRRVVPLGGDTRSVLEEHRSTLEPGARLVFPTSNGVPVTRSHARATLHRWAKRAGVAQLSPHGLRHTFASMAIAAGMSAPELARILGHKSAAFTMRTYVHFFERAEGRRALTLPELLGSENRAGVQLGGTSPQVDAERAKPN